jgi:acyl-CoA dehydrogenase
MVGGALGDMATEIDAAALLIYRAAWCRDVQKLSTTRRNRREPFVAKFAKF